MVKIPKAKRRVAPPLGYPSEQALEGAIVATGILHQALETAQSNRTTNLAGAYGAGFIGVLEAAVSAAEKICQDRNKALETEQARRKGGTRGQVAGSQT